MRLPFSVANFGIMRGMKSGILKFAPVYFNAPWAGTLIKRHFHRAAAPEVCSESWEISAHPQGMSRVTGGEYAGETLAALVQRFGRELVGTKAPQADKFPLLFKLIDARWPLSLQIHPNEQTAKLTGGDPKTEAWYVIKAYPGAVLYAGLKRRFSEAQLRDIVSQGPLLLDQLNPLKENAGDILFIPGGMTHAIGGGSFIYEVQQTSDTTYRFYDWDRKGADGKGRALHIEESFKSIDYELPPAELNRSGELQTRFFHIREQTVDGELELAPDGTSFIAGFVLEGATDVAVAGESFLVPATSAPVKLKSDGPAKLLLTTL